MAETGLAGRGTHICSHQSGRGGPARIRGSFSRGAAAFMLMIWPMNGQSWQAVQNLIQPGPKCWHQRIFRYFIEAEQLHAAFFFCFGSAYLWPLIVGFTLDAGPHLPPAPFKSAFVSLAPEG